MTQPEPVVVGKILLGGPLVFQIVWEPGEEPAADVLVEYARVLLGQVAMALSQGRARQIEMVE